MAVKYLTKESFSIKNYQIIELFNNVCTALRQNNNYEDRFIYLYKKLGFNYDKLIRLLRDITSIYDKLKEGYTEEEIHKYIPIEDIEFIQKCISEHDDFSVEIKRIFKIEATYNKGTIKEKADIYIRKILLVFEDEGVLKTLEQIILEDKLPLAVLTNDYFDNLPYFALADNHSRLKNSTYYLRDIFSLAKIAMCYDMLINQVHLGNTIPNIFGKEKDRIIVLANEAKYINGIKPDNLKDILSKNGLDDEKIEVNTKTYADYYSVRVEQTKEEERISYLKELEGQIDSCVLIVRRYIDHKILFVEDYLTINRVDKEKFYKAVQVLKENYHPIYMIYMEKIKKSKNQVDFDKLIDGIKNGVIVDGRKERDFDMVDYYQLTSLSPAETKKLAQKNLPYEDYIIVSSFVRRNINDRPLIGDNVKRHLEMKVSYVLEVDEHNNVISQYEATDDDKKTAMLLLGEMNIPLTQYTYKIMLRRYVMDKLKEEQKKKEMK